MNHPTADYWDNHHFSILYSFDGYELEIQWKKSFSFDYIIHPLNIETYSSNTKECFSHSPCLFQQTVAQQPWASSQRNFVSHTPAIKNTISSIFSIVTCCNKQPYSRMATYDGKAATPNQNWADSRRAQRVFSTPRLGTTLHGLGTKARFPLQTSIFSAHHSAAAQNCLNIAAHINT